MDNKKKEIRNTNRIRKKTRTYRSRNRWNNSSWSNFQKNLWPKKFLENVFNGFYECPWNYRQ